MAVAASVIIDKAAEQLHDEGYTRWTKPELLYWLNEAQRAIVMLRPAAKIASDVVQLQAGTKQSLPDDGIRLLSITRNMSSNGLTPGAAIRLTDRSILDYANPNWHSDTASSTVECYAYDANDPTRFYVYPPQPDSIPGSVEIAYSALPDECASETDTIDISEIYQSAIYEYIMFRALAKDAEYSGKNRIADSAYQMFLNQLGLKAQVDKAVSPNKTAEPHGKVENERP
jgi:hypothetical protein